MKLLGQLRKMNAEAQNPVAYFLNLDKNSYLLNPHIGKPMGLKWTGTITCIECGRKTRKSYDQGYCFVCSRDLPQNAMCSFRPELCVHEKGNEADREFWRTHCNIDHFVYLSLTSGVKVGITRHTNIPDRWIDQGAIRGLIIARVPQRILSGQIEVALAKHFADKTNWRKMLTNDVEDEDLVEWRNKLRTYIPEEAQEYFIASNSETNLNFPVLQYPKKVKSLNLDKTPSYKGVLKGIKGQYFIFEDNTVFNVRGSEGYYVSLTIA